MVALSTLEVMVGAFFTTKVLLTAAEEVVLSRTTVMALVVLV